MSRFVRYRWTFWIVPLVAACASAYPISHSRQWAKDALLREGYGSIVLTGIKPFSLWCSNRSVLAQGFIARGPHGERREGYVCTNIIHSYIVD